MKEYFKIFDEQKELVYLDSAATTHKPLQVIQAISDFYGKSNASVHRGLYSMASDATAMLEDARKRVAKFIGAEADEVIFTHSTTESINLIAYSLAEGIKEGDEVLVSIAEHHSNFLPWKELCRRLGAKFITFDICADGTINLKDFQQKLSERTKIVAISHATNVFGIKNPVKEITSLSHQQGALVVVDGAQAIAHQKVDVKELGADFYAFSGHKMYGPTGVGILYGRYSLLEKMPPFHFGGGMVEEVEGAIYRLPPHKFEAGSPMIGSIVGLSAAIDFIENIGLDNIAKKEKELSQFIYDALKDKVEFLTTSSRGAPILTFSVDDLHPTDVAVLLSLENICVRSGNMCAQPLLKRLGKKSLIRVSLGVYNDKADAMHLINCLSALKQTT